MKTFVLATSAICFLAGMIGAAQTAEPFLLKPLDHGAWVAIDNPAAKSQQSGSNAGFVIGSDSVLVVDTFENSPAGVEKMFLHSLTRHARIARLDRFKHGNVFGLRDAKALNRMRQ